jgi:hypothetical protein
MVFIVGLATIPHNSWFSPPFFSCRLLTIYVTLTQRASNKASGAQFKSVYHSITLRKWKQADFNPYHELASSADGIAMEL